MHRFVFSTVWFCILGLVACQQYASARHSQVLLNDPHLFPSDSEVQRYDEQANGKILTENVSQYVEHLMDIWHVKGLAVSVVHPDDEVEFGSWGWRTEDGDKITPDTLFNIGSCSKAFLAASVGIMMDQFDQGTNKTSLPGNIASLEWSTKLKDILPDDWKLQDEWASEKADIRDILTHRSGLPRHDPSYSPYDTARDVVRNLRNLKPAYELREHWHYNNQMYTTGSHIIQKYAGSSYPDFVEENIFKPLGMNSSTFWYSKANKTGRMTEAWSPHDQLIPYWLQDNAMDMIAGAGGVITSATDISKWLQMLLNSGVNPTTNKTVVPASAFEEATTAHSIVAGISTAPDVSLMGYGMGWVRMSYRGHEVVWHNGAIPGFSAFVAFLPQDKLGISIFINAADKHVMGGAVLYRIVDEVLGLPKIDRAQDPSKGKQTFPSRPENSSTPLNLTAYSGTYANDGYETFSFCDPTSSSFYCREVLADFNDVDAARSLPLPPSSSIPQLFSESSSIWASHVRLVHFEGNVFNMSYTALFPNGYGKNKTAFEIYEGDIYNAYAEFVVEDDKVVGFGLFDNGLLVKRKGHSVQERADAWFRRI